jgi:uncharacterized protein (DUF362 family)
MMTRRNFLAAGGGLAAAALGSADAARAEAPAAARTAVALVKDADRATAIPRALALLGANPVHGKRVLIKPNFNTADPFPASTHNDTLAALAGELRRMGAAGIALGERCGPPKTGEVLRDKGIPELCRRLDVGLINFEELPPGEWVRVRPPGSHWLDGFDVAKPVLDAEAVVSTCCLKTHAYGGVFTMSLKLSVGLTHKRNMVELHGSFRSMRKMIAELNLAYRPALILMDGTDVFTDGGPASGTLRHAGVVLAGTDRIAVDAVGLAVLKELGSNSAIMDTPIFRQEQIARAVELGLGIGGPGGIELRADDAASRAYASRLRTILEREAA